MVYVHIPFCRSFCTYCGFYSEVAPKCRETQFEEFASALVKEIETRHQDIQGVFASGDVNTLYIGGGTPSILPLTVFEKLLAALGRSKFDEFTVEVNPEDIVEKGQDYVEGLLELGINRVSMGVQSFDDRLLKWMNRRHSAAQAVEAYHILEEAGVENISIDLIFGLSQLSEELWRETLDKALNISSRGIPPRHISAYQLSVEEDSMLEKLIAKGRWSEASDDVCQRQYAVLCETLAEAGYHHYEISNFALPGYEAVHNSAYWRHVPYIGLGPGAHSYLADASGHCAPMTPHPDSAYIPSMRQWNVADLQAYLEAGEKGDFSAVQGGELLEQEQMVIERLMLGLRTSAGVPETFMMENCGREILEDAFRCGNLVRCDGRIRIPEDRFFISDSIVLNLCGA